MRVDFLVALVVAMRVGLGAGFSPLSMSRRPRQSTDLRASANSLSRRQFAELTVAGVGALTTFLGTRENKDTDYGLYGVLPIGPYKRKKTVMEEVVPGEVYTFDQKFGILNVQVPVRCTVVRLEVRVTCVVDTMQRFASAF